jgi:hypothetical protein
MNAQQQLARLQDERDAKLAEMYRRMAASNSAMPMR